MRELERSRIESQDDPAYCTDYGSSKNRFSNGFILLEKIEVKSSPGKIEIIYIEIWISNKFFQSQGSFLSFFLIVIKKTKVGIVENSRVPVKGNFTCPGH
jgi:hypothetical protein